jgi:hypothetical protein
MFENIRKNLDQLFTKVPNKKIAILIFVAIYLSAVITSVNYAVYRYYDLSHHRDLGFFLEFPAKILDPELTNRYRYAPGGTNIFGLAGTEGQYGFHKTTHFSPIKYTYILVYKLFSEPMGLFVYFSSLFFLPILYIPLIHRQKNWLEFAFVTLFVLLFVFSPNTLMTSTGEIRPRMLYNAFIPLTFLAIHYNRPLLEKAIFFTGLLAIREEGMIFGLILIIYSAIHISDEEDKKRTLRTFSFIYLINAVVVCWYFFIYSNFPYSEGNSILSILSTRPTLLVSFIILGVVYVVTILGLWKISTSNKSYILWGFESKKHGTMLFKMLVFSSFFFPFIVTSLSDVLNKASGERTVAIVYYAAIRLLTYYWFSIIYIVLLLLFVILWDGMSSQRSKERVLLILTILFVFTSFIFYQAHPNFPDYFSATPEKQPIAPLMDLRDITDPYETNILIGYNAYPILYDYNNIYVYWLLPIELVGQRGRGYPKNSDAVTSLIDDVIDYIVINKSDLIRLESIINATQVEMRVYAENQKIIIFDIDR